MNIVGKINDYKIIKTKAGNPQVAIRFACEDAKIRTWYGSFKGGAQPYTLDTLLRCGFSGKDPMMLDAGVESNLLDTEKELDLVVEVETYEGKEREKVKWVNEIGNSAFKNEFAKGEAVKQFAGMNLKAALAARKVVTPVKKTVNAPVEDEDEDVLF